jgi:hypothetical protein
MPSVTMDRPVTLGQATDALRAQLDNRSTITPRGSGRGETITPVRPAMTGASRSLRLITMACGIVIIAVVQSIVLSWLFRWLYRARRPVWSQ